MSELTNEQMREYVEKAWDKKNVTFCADEDWVMLYCGNLLTPRFSGILAAAYAYTKQRDRRLQTWRKRLRG